jgi:DNA repair exonuclease SbcCD nuclease subunit
LASELKALNYNYWALGHIHLPQNDENIFYAGTLQGRNTKETGAHGFRYIQVENNVITNNEFINSDVIRYEDISVDLSETDNVVSAYDKIIEIIEDKIISQNAQLYLVRLNLIGSVGYLSEIDDKFFTSIAERINVEYSQKICISNFYNNLIAKVDEENLKANDGIVGEIYSVLKQEGIIKSSFDMLKKQMRYVLPDCDFSSDEFEDLKNELIFEVKEKCLNICNIVYNNENSEVIDE